MPHLELTREVVRRFQGFFGELFPEPQPLLTHFPRLPGLDNRKMSKSYANTIDLSDDAATASTRDGVDTASASTATASIGAASTIAASFPPRGRTPDERMPL